jgi:hypothetical protein
MAPLAYGVLIFFLRVSGKRMLSKMSAFDLVVTIALGSTLATILLSKDVTLAEGIAALGLLIPPLYGSIEALPADHQIGADAAVIARRAPARSLPPGKRLS